MSSEELEVLDGLAVLQDELNDEGSEDRAAIVADAERLILALRAELDTALRRYETLRRIVFEDMQTLEMLRITAPAAFDAAIDDAAEAP